MTISDQCIELGAQRRIAEHFQMRGEDRRVLLPQFALDGIAIGRDFACRGLDCSRQTLEFGFHRIARDKPMRDPKTFGIHDHGFANGDTRRNGDSLKSKHYILSCWPTTRHSRPITRASARR